MPRGFGFVRSAAADIENRKNSGGSGGGKLYFKLADGESAVVRFLEQGNGIHGAWVHELLPPPGRQVGDKIPCRQYDDEGNYTGEDCPGCEQQLKKSFQGAINLIWRDAPVFQRDENNRMVKGSDGRPVVSGRADQIAVWVSGVTVFDELAEKDASFKGLCSRDFEVKRKGVMLTTRYIINPADPDGGPKSLSAADEALAADKYDLLSYEIAPPYDEWGVQKGSTSGGNVQPPADTSPFMRTRG